MKPLIFRCHGKAYLRQHRLDLGLGQRVFDQQRVRLVVHLVLLHALQRVHALALLVLVVLDDLLAVEVVRDHVPHLLGNVHDSARGRVVLRVEGLQLTVIRSGLPEGRPSPGTPRG
jgi:hypothetical protein